MFKSSTSVGQVKNHVAFPSPLNFYDVPPTSEVSIEEFETSALDRLRILAEIESSAARNRSWDEIKDVTSQNCKKFLPLSSSQVESANVISNGATKSDTELRRRDHLSHFVLRLAFCRSEDLRRRFLQAETTLFKVRYEAALRPEREAFLNSRDFNWIPVDEEEVKKFATQLEAAYGPTPDNNTRKYVKVKWTRVPDLVEKRRVFLRAGWAYVPGAELSSIIFQEFEDHLAKALETTARLLPRLDEDTRLLPILSNLSQGFLAGISSEWATASGSASGNEIKAEMVNDLARKHFPLCMRTLHESLQRDNHLKHFGRLQYGLFLKASTPTTSRSWVLGLSIDEAITFWRKSFSRITDDKFNKEYKYNIRHSFGLEGKRANYPAKSCVQLLAPGPSDYGCPYRNYAPENLQTALLSSYSHLGLRASDLPEIMTTVKAGHYHVACTRVFEITHASFGVAKGEGTGGGESVTHPNQYAARSMELQKQRDDMAID